MQTNEQADCSFFHQIWSSRVKGTPPFIVNRIRVMQAQLMLAMTSTSTSAFLGRAAAATQLRAGLVVKYLA